MSMRRFIAGAVCPECRAVDRIVVEPEEAGPRRRCVACGYTDTLATGSPAEPVTRLGRKRSAAGADPESRAVRIIGPPGTRR